MTFHETNPVMKIRDLISSKRRWMKAGFFNYIGFAMRLLPVNNQYSKTTALSYPKTVIESMCLGAATILVARQELRPFGRNYVSDGRCSIPESQSLKLMADVIKEQFPERITCSCQFCNFPQLHVHESRKTVDDILHLHIIETFNDDIHTTFDHVQKVMDDYQRRIDNQ
jgi:hypothetical protein